MMEQGSVSIRIEGVRLSFDDTEVLKGIDLAIEPGELFAFLGPSGSGKSTLLRAIAGFGPTPQGRIMVGGMDITRLPPWKRNVGMVFQSYALWPHMTVRRNVGFGLEERRVPKREIRERVDRALELVGLLDLAERRPSQLSGGQQQRIALARTVVVEPRVLLLDEPLSNLDANLRVQMRREILELQRELGLTTIFVTHDQEEANTISDRMAVLDQGVIQQVGSPMELYDNPANLFVANFLGTANVLSGIFDQGPGGSLFRTPDGIEIPLREPVAEGAGHVLFRPQSLRIGSGSGEPGEIRLRGRVGHREFLGSLVRYEVQVGGQRLILDDTHLRRTRPREIGGEVDLYLTSNQVIVVSG